MAMRAHSQHKQCRKPFEIRFFNSINNRKVRHIDSANNNHIRNVLWHVYDRRDVNFYIVEEMIHVQSMRSFK